MASTSTLRLRIGRNKLFFIVGVPLLCFVLAPIPLGLGLIYSILDTLRGHPQGRHGAQPQNFVGLWIREEYVEFDSLGQAFYLMPNGRFAGMPGMTERRWHFDENSLFIDAVSRCGNCYQGNVITELTVKFEGADQVFLTNRNKKATRGIVGKYCRVPITDALKSEMGRQKESKDVVQSFEARTVLTAIEQFEILTKLKR